MMLLSSSIILDHAGVCLGELLVARQPDQYP